MSHGNEDVFDEDIDSLLDELDVAGVNSSQFRIARKYMDRQQLKNTLLQLLKAHVMQAVYREQLSDRLVCPKCRRDLFADKSFVQTGFCPQCNTTMNFESAM